MYLIVDYKARKYVISWYIWRNAIKDVYKSDDANRAVIFNNKNDALNVVERFNDGGDYKVVKV